MQGLTIKLIKSMVVYFFQQADRPREEGRIFTYPYDLGWKENIKQVSALIFDSSDCLGLCIFQLKRN